MDIEHLTAGEALSHAAQVMEAALSGQPTPTPFGIIDPDYARIFSKARVIAWQYGYSCCAQGSFTRDLDLLIVPWTDCATLQLDALVSRIADVCGLRIQGEPSSKPHGRKAWSLLLPGFSEVRWVDLSAFPPKINPLTPGD